jgi:hypothetical protein
MNYEKVSAPLEEIPEFVICDARFKVRLEFELMFFPAPFFRGLQG